MADYIDKSKLKDALRTLYRYESFPIADIEQLFDSIPVMDMEFVKHGHWTNYKDEHTCSVCHATVCEEVLDGEWGSQGIYDYCPYCGAKMDEVE